MDHLAHTQNRSLSAYRDYLHTLARLQLGVQWQGKVDASDVVQQTILRAHAGMHQFRGTSEAEWLGWLRTILAHVLSSISREYKTAARDVDRELSLEAELERSSARLEKILAVDQSSPSQAAIRSEDLLKLAHALVRLPGDERSAVELHHLKGMTVAEVAEELGRSRSAIVGLLFRAMKRLRKLFNEQLEPDK